MKKSKVTWLGSLCVARVFARATTLGRATTFALLVVPSWGAAACATSTERGVVRPSASGKEYGGPLQNTRELGAEFVWEQEITARYGDRAQSFGAVLQHADGALTVLGLTPFNTRAFSIEQRGYEFSFHNYVGRKLPFDPKSILIDIHRTFFVGMSAPRSDGEHVTLELGERRVDVWRSGKLVRRSFERVAEPGKKIEVDYGAGYAPGVPPARALFENHWYGYALEVVTTSATEL